MLTKIMDDQIRKEEEDIAFLSDFSESRWRHHLHLETHLQVRTDIAPVSPFFVRLVDILPAPATFGAFISVEIGMTPSLHVQSLDIIRASSELSSIFLCACKYGGVVQRKD
jgi:hypothetical protein